MTKMQICPVHTLFYGKISVKVENYSNFKKEESNWLCRIHCKQMLWHQRCSSSTLFPIHEGETVWKVLTPALWNMEPLYLKGSFRETTCSTTPAAQ